MLYFFTIISLELSTSHLFHYAGSDDTPMPEVGILSLSGDEASAECLCDLKIDVNVRATLNQWCKV